MRVLKKEEICFVMKYGNPLSPLKPLMNAKSFSPEEKLVSFMVSSSRGCEHMHTLSL